jgi:hypothetical protein
MGEIMQFFLQMARMILDVRGLIDWIWKQNNVKWYWECAASYCLIPNGSIPLTDEHVLFLLTQTSWLWRVRVNIGT